MQHIINIQGWVCIDKKKVSLETSTVEYDITFMHKNICFALLYSMWWIQVSSVITIIGGATAGGVGEGVGIGVEVGVGEGETVGVDIGESGTTLFFPPFRLTDADKKLALGIAVKSR